MPKAKYKLEPIELPRINPIRVWSESPQNTFEKWKAKSERAATESERDACLAKAYVCDDGFYHYCQDFICDQPLHRPFHGRMANFMVGVGLERYHVKTTRGILAFRGSWKSTIGVGFDTWNIAREYVLAKPVLDLDAEAAKLRNDNPDDSDNQYQAFLDELAEIERKKSVLISRGTLSGVNIRIGIQSEALELAETRIQSCCNAMDKPLYQKYFGAHGPKDRRKGAQWGKKGAISVYRTNTTLLDPTLSTISLDAPRIGAHFDIILADDFQSELSSASRIMRNKSWDMWKGNMQLITPPSTSYYSLTLFLATRWHSNDNYGRILQENESKAKRDRVEILTMPVCREDGVATCPTIYATDDIPSLRSEGVDKFNTQYLLRPVGGKTQPIQHEWITHSYYNPLALSDQKRGLMYAVTGADFCWIEAARKGDTDSDHSVVFTMLVGTDWSFWLIDVWREQTTRTNTLEEVFRQSQKYDSVSQGFSVSDRKHVEGDLNRMEFDKKFNLNPVWVSDLKGGQGVDSDTHKQRKLIGTLQPLFMNGKMHLPIGLNWLEQELLDLPKGTTDDGLDAMVCCVSAAGHPATAKKEYQPHPEGYEWGRFVAGLKNGRPVHLDGTPMKPRGKIARGAMRRPRNRIITS